MHILVSGGAGYIGSHTVAALSAAGFTPIILDDFQSSERSIPDRIATVTGKKITCIEGDFADTKLLTKVLREHDIKGVVHFAAFKAVGESVEQPIKYYRNNVSGFVNLVDVLSQHNVPLVFSSSAAVYGNLPPGRITEDMPCSPESPYGQSKLMDEIILRDTCRAGAVSGIALRYFNAVGAHDSGKLGELPKLPPLNVLPIIVQATAGERGPLLVFGNDYDTPDGTCLRDYIHVADLAEAHVAALNHLFKQPKGYYDVFNVGTGKPTSVMELITMFEKINKTKVPYEIHERRPGDTSIVYADTAKIKKALGWQAHKTIEDAVRDAWQWQLNIAKESSKKSVV